MSTAEIRSQEIKMRRLEIAATLAAWKRDFFVSGIERPMASRVTLEAELASLNLELRQIGDAATLAKVERRKHENDCLLRHLMDLLNERGLADVVDEAHRRLSMTQTEPTT
jgi:hypothetical protein